MSTPPTEIAYAYIRDRILSNEFRPGMTLSALGLSKKIGVSRTPVLFSLRDLEKEGLVTIQPGVGAVVRSISTIEEYEELLSLRELLETFAAELAAQRRTETDLLRIGAELEKLKVLQKLKKASDMNEKRERELNMADSNFHFRIAQAAKHRLLLEEIGRHSFIHRVIFYPFKNFASSSNDQIVSIQQESLADHVRIYEAIRDQNPTATREAMKTSFQTLRKNNLLAISAKQELEWQHPHTSFQ